MPNENTSNNDGQNANPLAGGGAPSANPAPSDPKPTPDPAPAPNPAPENPLADPSGGEPEWRKEIPDEYKDHQMVKNAKSVGDIVKSWAHAQSMVGKDKIVIPDENATAEDWAAVYNKLGRPESKDKYELEVNKEVGVDEHLVNGFKEAAHKSGLTQSQAKEVLSWYTEYNKESANGINQQSQDKIKADIDALKQEWGSSYDAAIKNAQTGARYYEEKIPELKDLLSVPEVGSNPGMLKLMKMVGERVGEGKLEDGGDVKHFGLSPAEAKEKANKIIGNYDEEKNPYYKKDHPDHDRTVKEVQELMEIASSASSNSRGTF